LWVLITTVTPLQPEFGARVEGVDLRHPLTGADFIPLDAAIARYGVLIFPAQALDDEQQMAFAMQFGPLENAHGGNIPIAVSDRRIRVGMNDVSNLDKQGRPLAPDSRQRLFNLGNMLWHSDSSFRAVPAKYSILSARLVNPRGGNTEFADMRAAWDALDDDTRAEIDSLVCEHSLMHSRGALGFPECTEEERRLWHPVRQSLVRTHPVTGRRSLYLSAHAGAIVGMETPAARILLRDLNEHATQPQFVHVHRWQLHDVVMWDNRQTMHRVRRYDERLPRDMRRTTVAGEAMTVAQAA
jgi:alpha-ketoglutarate-dependent 2,4-dichlorophenoxyacetate dioxygenase